MVPAKGSGVGNIALAVLLYGIESVCVIFSYFCKNKLRSVLKIRQAWHVTWVGRVRYLS